MNKQETQTGTGFSQIRIDTALREFRRFLNGKRCEPMLSVYTLPDYRQESDTETMIEKACTAIRFDGASGRDDIVPTFWPDYGTTSTAAIWGGERITTCDGNPHIEPVIHGTDELESLEPGQTFEESDFQRAIDNYREVCHRLGTGEVFVRTPDFQGPMNTLALIMDQTELLCGLYESPDTIRHALEKITDVLITTLHRFRREIGAEKVIGNIWPYVALPDGRGVAITQDMMPLLSPELYADFELPLLKRISDEFGGVWIHCCGRYAQHLTNLRESGVNILGLEFHHPFTPFEDIHRVFGDDIAYLPYLFADCKDFDNDLDFAKHLLARATDETRFWFIRTTDANDIAAMQTLISP